MVSGEYLLLLAGMGLVTYGPRWAPLFFMTRRQLPPWLLEWLDLIPAAILGALLVPELLSSPGGEQGLGLMQPRLLAALPTLLIAWKTRSLGGTVVAGMLIYWLLTALFGSASPVPH